MIVVEGPDLAGKTTLAKVLSKQLSIPYIHMSSPGPAGDWAQVNAILAEYEYKNTLIADRFVLSDYAYRPIWPHPVPNQVVHLQRFIAWMRLTKSVFIQADVPDEVIAMRYASRGDEAEQLDADKIVQTAQLYRRMFDALRATREIQIFRYDSSQDQPEWFGIRNVDRLLDATVTRRNPRLETIAPSETLSESTAAGIATP